MSYTTRQVSAKLRRYADFLEAEKHRAAALFDLTNRDSTAETVRALEDEIEEVTAMANHLWEAKEQI
jgi:hypothetical protein